MIDFFNIMLGVFLGLIAIGYGNFLVFIYNRIKAKKMKSLTMKEELIELIEDTLHDWECDVSDKTISEIAEHLIDNGVVIVEDLK